MVNSTKRILLLRHTYKGSDGLITPEGFTHIVETAPKLGISTKRPPTDLFYSAVRRSKQTLHGILGVTVIHSAHLHDPVSGLGNELWFDQIVKIPGCTALIKTKGNRVGIMEAMGEEGFQAYRVRCAEPYEAMFDSMVGNYGLGVGHSPCIDAAAEYFGCTFPESFAGLAELQGVMFTQHKDGTITAELYIPA